MSLLDSTATVPTCAIRLTMYLGSPTSSHQSLGSLTMSEGLSVLTCHRSIIQPSPQQKPLCYSSTRTLYLAKSVVASCRPSPDPKGTSSRVRDTTSFSSRFRSRE